MTATSFNDQSTAAERFECWHLLKPTAKAVGINAVAAWKKTRGSGVNVAIVDTGVEFTHPSLTPNISLGEDGLPDQARDFDANLDAKGRSVHDGGCIANPFDAHGTACAGIVGAAHREGVDVVGVAPECRLVPVRINANFEPQVLEAALRYAAEVGDVILLARYLPRAPLDRKGANGSEYEKERNEGLRRLEETLRRIASKVPVVCASGNDGKKGLVFPACLPETIAVGACNEKGWRSTYSQFGEQLDVVAPSNDIPIETRDFIRLDSDEVERRRREKEERTRLRVGGTIPKACAEQAPEYAGLAEYGHLAEFGPRAIATTDNLGTTGYNFEPAGDYCKADGNFGFGGTSAAAAQVAGVVALMLGLHPTLKGDVNAVRERLRHAASSRFLHSRGDCNEEFGYGLVDAEEALR